MCGATHVDFNPVEGKDGGVRFLSGHVAVELVDASVPLDSVDGVAV